MSFNSFCALTNDTAAKPPELEHLQLLFKNIQLVLCIFGIIGNILNLRTLQCPSLKTIPFMYIRALAIFDLCGLSCILYGFQLYRNISNMLEVLNHCLNFYVFCMASSEYTRAFIVNCFCLRHAISMCPGCVKLINGRRSSSLSYGQSVNNSIMIGPMNNSSEDEISMTQKNVMVRWRSVDRGETVQQQTPLVHSCPNKGILRKEKESPPDLTIVNEHALEEDVAFQETDSEVYI
ncbi:unnamed protein product, partial [Mesorhabditis spiculigera]